MKQYYALSTREQSILPFRSDADSQWIGVEASDTTLEWLWKKKLSIVGSDNVAFESVPFNATISGKPRALHQVFIGGWGQSIGEPLRYSSFGYEAVLMRNHFSHSRAARSRGSRHGMS